MWVEFGKFEGISFQRPVEVLEEGLEIFHRDWVVDHTIVVTYVTVTKSSRLQFLRLASEAIDGENTCSLCQ